MKIGILTLPFNNNYGGYMQAFALMTVLKQMGHEPTIIMRRHQKPDVSISAKVKYLLRGIVKSIISREYHSFIYNVENNYRLRGKNMLVFVNKYMQPQTNYLYTTQELRKYCNKRFDAYIVGSDQVWRAIYVPGIVGNMFLDFTEGWNVKRISYAASFGTCKPEYTEQEKRFCGLLIEKFDAVSLREDSGLEVFQDFGWNVKKAKVVLDPTLLLSKEDYNKCLPPINNQVEGKIFCYVLDKSDDSIKMINRVKDIIKKQLYEISDIQKGNSVLPSIENWLTAIRDAAFVVTDSFHGMIFSIIMQKPFIVKVNKNRGSDRFVSFLSRFGLKQRIVDSEYDVQNALNYVVDWNNVRKILEQERQKSLGFLEKSLT